MTLMRSLQPQSRALRRMDRGQPGPVTPPCFEDMLVRLDTRPDDAATR